MISTSQGSKNQGSKNQGSKNVLSAGDLRRVHHIALNVKDMQASRYFYGTILGLHELTGEEVPETLVELFLLIRNLPEGLSKLARSSSSV